MLVQDYICIPFACISSIEFAIPDKLKPSILLVRFSVVNLAQGSNRSSLRLLSSKEARQSKRGFVCCAGQGIWLGNLLKGYNPVTFMVVANLAFSGLLVSWVMKFADSIMKVLTFLLLPLQRQLQTGYHSMLPFS